MNNLVKSILFLSISLTLFLTSSAFASPARFVSLEGQIEMQRSGTNSWTPASENSTLSSGDSIRTKSDSRVAIILEDGSTIRLGPGSVLTLPGDQQDDGFFLNIGKLFMLSRESDHKPTVRTPLVSAAIRGTEIVVETNPKSSVVAVLDGKVECSNTFGTVNAETRQLVMTKPGRAPEVSLLVNPEKYTQWLMYLPDLKIPEHLSSREKDILSQAVSRLKSGGQLDFSDSLLLSSTARSYLFSLQSLQAVAQDRQDLALELSEKAIASETKNIEARIARSYALQSMGRIENALEVLPATSDDPFILAKRAELSMGLDDIETASDLIAQSLRQDPTSSYALTISGFLALVQNEVALATERFEDATRSNPSFPLARLGLGLAKTRVGERVAGIDDLKLAVALAPDVSIYRSYLGKALFELDMPAGASEEFERARRQDPNDPTPYLYRAFLKLSRNDLIGSLADLEESQDRNQNRAVYRSSLLLDQDTSTRSTGLSQIYAGLGFTELSRVEAIRSISTDYKNFSAHKFLADSYLDALRTDASLSERAIANILSPLGFGSLQPEQPTSLGEYTALLERNQNRVGIRSGYDSRLRQFGNQVYTSGRDDKWGYFANVSSFVRNESAIDDALLEHRVQGALQYQPQFGTKFYLDQNLFLRNISPGDEDFAESDINLYSSTFGLNQRLGKNATLLASAQYQRGWNRFRSLNEPSVVVNQDFGGGDTESFPIDVLLFERYRERINQVYVTSQFLYSEEDFSIIAGVETTAGNVTDTEISQSVGGQLTEGSKLRSTDDAGYGSNAAFSYVTLKPLEDISFTIGGNCSQITSQDRSIPPFTEGTTTDSRCTPKIGATWEFMKGTTLRTGYFESFAKPNLENVPSLEPTLVGGINQKFFDNPHTFSRNAGVGIDSKIFEGTYIGTEYLHRNIDELSIAPAQYDIFINQVTGAVSQNVARGDRQDVHQHLDLVTVYWYQVLARQWSLSTDYRYTRYETTDPDLFEDRETQRLKSSLGWFGSSGMFSRVTGRVIDQSIIPNTAFNAGNSNAWLMDLSVGYRLPNRRGILQLEARNIFDRDFLADPVTELDEFLIPGFALVASVQLNF